MFTGIVTDMGEVRSVKPRADNLHRITISCAYPRAELIEGASIACSGVCMTVVETGEEDGRTWFGVDAAAETLAVTTVGRWRHGTRINLERSLKLGDELGGHLVAGHVDGLANVIAREDMTDMARFACARRATGALHRGQGLGRARRRLAHGQRGRGRHLLGADHPAHARVTTFGALRAGRRRQSRNRHHGPLCRAADGRALVFPRHG